MKDDFLVMVYVTMLALVFGTLYLCTKTLFAEGFVGKKSNAKRPPPINIRVRITATIPFQE